MTETQRRYGHARNDFKRFHVDKAQELIAACDAAVAEARALAEAQRETLEQLRPFWAQGYTSDSEAAQASANALTELWKLLGVNNQTHAVIALRALLAAAEKIEL